MVSAWGNSWGVSWGNSWGAGVAPPVVPVAPSGGWYSHHTPYQIREQQERLAELRRIENEITEAEQRKLEALAQQEQLQTTRKYKNAAKKRAVLEATLQDEINALLVEKMRLIRLIDDEESILVLLLSLPFH